MNIVVTGSLGNVSKPLATRLIEAGHMVTVVSSNPGRAKDIEAIGATAAIGKLEDVDFLISAFTGADAVYCMVPFSFKASDHIAYLKSISHNYALAIQKAGIKQAVFLSGWAAEILPSYQEIENSIAELPDVAVALIRPGYFYSNFFASLEMINKQGIIAATFGENDKIVFSAPSDIADVIFAELTQPSQGIKVRYVASDEMTCDEAAGVIGKAIGKPHLKWVVIKAKDMQKTLEENGLTAKFAKDIVEMQAPIHEGLMPQEFSRHYSEVVRGKIKLADFAQVFSHVFHSN